MIVIYAKTAKKGLSYDKKGYSVLEGDDLPVVGEKYVLALFVQEDGSLLASGRQRKLITVFLTKVERKKRNIKKLCN